MRNLRGCWRLAVLNKLGLTTFAKMAGLPGIVEKRFYKSAVRYQRSAISFEVIGEAQGFSRIGYEA